MYFEKKRKNILFPGGRDLIRNYANTITKSTKKRGYRLCHKIRREKPATAFAKNRVYLLPLLNALST